MLSTVGDIADFYSAHPECIGKLNVQTRNGYKQVQFADITAYDSNILRVDMSDGSFLEASPDHRVMCSTFNWVKTKDLCINDEVITKNGIVNVVSIKQYDFTEDLYDLQVDGHEYYTNGIVSHNSTILDALTFALFGKPFRNINKPQLINSITNRDALVELEFMIGRNHYMIRRGLKPNVFEVFCNDVLLNQEAEMRDYQ